MTWQAVARKDFRDAIRSWWLWGLSVVFIVFFTVPAYLLARDIGGLFAAEGETIGSDVFIGLLAEINAFFVPIIAIVIAYAAIAGERDSGSLKLLLSLPHSRRDVVIGKLVGRSLVVAIPVIIGFVAAILIFLVTPVDLELVNLLGFTLLTVVLAIIFTGIAVGISAAARTGRQAMIGTVGVYVLFTLFWTRFSRGLSALLQEYTSIADTTLVWTELGVLLFNPSHAYKSLSAILYLDGAFEARMTMAFDVPVEFADALREEYGSLPAYYSDPAVALLLVAWIVVPPLLGYLVFKEADL